VRRHTLLIDRMRLIDQPDDFAQSQIWIVHQPKDRKSSGLKIPQRQKSAFCQFYPASTKT